MSEDFTKPENVYFVAGRVTEIDAASRTGKIEWKCHRRRVSLDFNYAGFGFAPDTSSEFPAIGLFALPDGDLHALTAVPARGGFALKEDPLKGRVTWELRAAASGR